LHEILPFGVYASGYRKLLPEVFAMSSSSESTALVKPRRKLPLKLLLLAPLILQAFAALGLVGYFALQNSQRTANGVSQQLPVGQQTFIIDRSGNLIAGSDLEGAAPQPPQRKLSLSPAIEAKNPLVRETASALLKEFDGFASIAASQQLEFTLSGKRQFVQVTPIRDEDGIDWLSISVAPEPDLMAQLGGNALNLLLGIGAIGATTSLGIFAARRIAKPILQIQDAGQALARAAGAGQTSVQLDPSLQGQGIAELESIASTFNQMASQLQNSVATLDLRVEERTAKLAQAKEVAEVAKEMAEVANQAKSESLAIISHELRTPLNSILSYATILRRDYPQAATDLEKRVRERQLRGLDIVEKSGKHLLLLINDLLDLAKIEAGKLEFEPAEFEFLPFLQDVSEMIRAQSHEKGLTLQLKAEEGLPKQIYADQKRLRQVLLNLLSNAVKFTWNGQVTLQVNVRKPGRVDFSQPQLPRICFRVTDSGVGISSEKLAKLFHPFEQVGDLSSRTRGTGLGLAISKQIVGLMGGQLLVKSQQGQGSTFWFTVTLPESAEAAEVKSFATVKDIIDLPELIETETDAAEAESTSETGLDLGKVMTVNGYSGERRRILVVDDDEANRMVLINMLEPIGFEVLPAEDGSQGLEVATLTKPHLVITDLFMPKKTGATFMRDLLEIPDFQNTPVILASANNNRHIIQNFSRKSGYVAFLPKPINLNRLLGMLQYTLHLEWVYKELKQC
jgi:signal transduction histidine kinase/ActR/RegA family two-component response regulator